MRRRPEGGGCTYGNACQVLGGAGGAGAVSGAAEDSRGRAGTATRSACPVRVPRKRARLRPEQWWGRGRRHAVEGLFFDGWLCRQTTPLRGAGRAWAAAGRTHLAPQLRQLVSAMDKLHVYAGNVPRGSRLRVLVLGDGETTADRLGWGGCQTARRGKGSRPFGSWKCCRSCWRHASITGLGGAPLSGAGEGRLCACSQCRCRPTLQPLAAMPFVTTPRPCANHAATLRPQCARSELRDHLEPLTEPL